jgi:hypothetical protein
MSTQVNSKTRRVDIVNKPPAARVGSASRYTLLHLLHELVVDFTTTPSLHISNKADIGTTISWSSRTAEQSPHRARRLPRKTKPHTGATCLRQLAIPLLEYLSSRIIFRLRYRHLQLLPPFLGVLKYRDGVKRRLPRGTV